APRDEVVGQRPGLVAGPGLEGGDELALVDQAVLEREQAEEQVAVGVGAGHRWGSPGIAPIVSVGAARILSGGRAGSARELGHSTGPGIWRAVGWSGPIRGRWRRSRAGRSWEMDRRMAKHLAGVLLNFRIVGWPLSGRCKPA